MPSASLARVRAVGSALRARSHRSDTMVVAAALTCYAALGLVPLLAIAVRVATAATSAAHAPWWTALAALLPVSLYAEGTVRSLERFSRAPERRSRTLRGRALTPVFVVLASVFVVVTVAWLRPLLSDPFGTGLGPRLLGILIAFNVLFFAVFGALLLVYRLFASTPLRAGPLAFASFAAASWIAGQTLGYVVAIRVVSGFDNAFGGYAPVAEFAALLFLVYLQHLILVFGYLLALTLHENGVER